ncbi:MAG: carboxymethylenebutenolidase [Pseudonocardiales bacterium]|nr:carboxymethylenebutenolidase [Pseudonocardiales bacterium]MDT4962734.1 carboxymethylenebutenolidase [Pseudonocardiales bacterium]
MPTVDLESPLGSQSLTAYVAYPAANGPRPGVVALHEVFGLDDVMRRQADRLAAAGYLTIAPDLFSDGGPRRCLVSTFRSMATGRGKAFADIEASRQWLLEQPDCTGKVGVIGFCMGGAFALVTSTTGFDVASANYGMVPRHAEQALAGACPIVASYGRWDGMVGMAGKLERTLTTLGIEHDVKTYPNAGHSFLNDAPNGPVPLRPLMKVLKVGPEPAAAADAWRRIEAFFAKHLA